MAATPIEVLAAVERVFRADKNNVIRAIGFIPYDKSKGILTFERNTELPFVVNTETGEITTGEQILGE